MKFGRRKRGKTCCATPSEGRNKIPWVAITKYVCSHTDDSTCIKHSVDAALAMVSHHQAAKLEPSIGKPSFGIIPEFNGRIVVLEVGGICISTKVAPFSNH